MTLRLGVSSPDQEYVEVSWNGSSVGTVPCGEKEDQESLEVVSEPGPHNLSARFLGSLYLYPAEVNRTIWVKVMADQSFRCYSVCCSVFWHRKL